MKRYRLSDLGPDPRWPDRKQESWPEAIGATVVWVLVCALLYAAILTVGAVR